MDRAVASDHPMTLKSLSLAIGIIVAGQALVTFLVLPGVMRDTIEEVEKRISTHVGIGHPSQVTKWELSIALKQMETLATKESVRSLDARLQRIEQQLARLMEK